MMLAKQITGCEYCPIHEKDCHGVTSDGRGNPIEPPCCYWSDDTEVYEGMYSNRELEWEEYFERLLESSRKSKAKRAAETRKQYVHLNEKYTKFKEWLQKSSWLLIVSSRRKDCVYMRSIYKRRANYVFNLEKEQFRVIKGKLGLGDYTMINKFENDFKEFYYGERPKDRDFVKECFNSVNEFFGM